MSSGKWLWLATIFAVITITGCRTVSPPEHQSGTIWTISELENELGGSDPCEPFNRGAFAVTHFVMEYIADPLGRVYTTILPRPVIEHLHQVCINLEFPARCVSCLLRAQWRGAGDETLRFLINSTLGVAGIFDVAQAWWMINSTDSDFGQTFRDWGIGSGCTFMLPLIPALNIRDMTGMIFDTALDMKTYIPYAGSATALNRMVMAQKSYSQIVSGSVDPYKSFRQLMLLQRELRQVLWFYRKNNQIREEIKEAELNPPPPQISPLPQPKPAGLNGRWVELYSYFSQGAVTDSLRVAHFYPRKSDDFWYMPLSLFNSDFASKCSNRKISLNLERSDMRYGFWRSEKAAKKLAVILPGIGGNYFANFPMGLAEIFHQRGYAVASFNSTFSWQFINSDKKLQLPGFLPDDANRMRCLLREVIADLAVAELIDNPQIILIGYSMGAMQALKIAEIEDKDNSLNISRYIAVNPPVSIRYAMNRIDQLVAVSSQWNKTQVRAHLTEAGGNLLMAFARRLPPLNPDIPEVLPEYYQIEILDSVANYVAGLSLKLSLRNMLFAYHRERKLPGLPEYEWGNRNNLYIALDKLTLQDYAEKFLVLTYPEKQLAELFFKSDLRSIAPFLAVSDKIRILHSYDDFLLSAEDLKFLDQTMKSRLVWFSNGGHLGNLYLIPMQRELLAAAGEE